MATVAPPEDIVLAIRNVYVSYGEIEALRGVDFSLRRGEIHALVGEHRAGKSTLVHVISGAVRRARGEFVLKGAPVANFSPKLAIKNGIATVYQDVNIVSTLTAPEFLFTGRMPTRLLGLLNRQYMIREATELFDRYGIELDLTVPLAELPEDKQLMVELVRAISLNPDVIIFDEISNKLTPEEMETTFRILHEYKDAGKSVIYISHNLDEVFELADRVTVLKDGRRLGTEEVKDLDRIKLIKMTYSYVMSREELSQSNRELYYFTKYNEAIIRNIPIGVVILDENNCVYLTNYSAMQIMHTGTVGGKGTPVEEIFVPGKMPLAEEILDRIRERREERWEDADDGTGAKLRISTYPFKDEDYKFLGTIILVEDISKERFFDDYLLRTEKISSVAELAAGVAHEINNPIGICLNYVELLSRHVEDDYGSEKVERVRKELNRIADVIKSLLSFSQVNRNSWGRIDVRALIEETVVLVEHLYRQKSIRLAFDARTSDAIVQGDENQLKQVLINLLKNSIEAILDQGSIDIVLSKSTDGGTIEISVIDDGCGIPPDIESRIFDPFFSSKITKQNTGLGLSISQHIVENHDGIIELSAGEKTTATVRLPSVN